VRPRGGRGTTRCEPWPTPSAGSPGSIPPLYEATLRSVERDSPEVQAAAEDVLEILYAVLSGYRIRGEEAVHATRHLRSVLHRFTSLEAAGGFGMPTDLEACYWRIVEALVANLGNGGCRRN
jgi:hypothetical protein